MELERIAKLEAQVEELKSDVKEVREDIKEVHSRITTQTREIVDKLDDFQSRIEHKMQASAVASQQQHEAIKTTLQEEIKKVATQLDTDIKEVSKRVDVLERWRWMIVGGAIVLGYVTGHMGIFSKIFGG